MASKSDNIEITIKKYRDQLKQFKGITCKKILIYGSRMRGTAIEGSDIDLIVISDDWKKYSQRERLEILGIAAARILKPIQAVGFTPDEIKKNEITPFWREIIEHASKAA